MINRPKSKRHRTIPRLAATLFALAAPLAAQAQSTPASDADLRGVTGLRVTLSPMSAASMECGLRGADLTPEVETALTTGGMAKPNDNSDLAIVTVITGRDGASGLCSSAIMLGAYESASFVDDHVGWVRTGYVVLWQSGLMVTSAPDDHLDTVRRALGELSGAMLEEWHRANTAQ